MHPLIYQVYQLAQVVLLSMERIMEIKVVIQPPQQVMLMAMACDA
jgi:hypothetical protein